MIRMNYNKQFNAPRYVELFSTSCLLLLTELSELGGQGEGRTPQDFDRSVNPISTSWQIMPTTLLLPPPPTDLQTFQQPWCDLVLLFLGLCICISQKISSFQDFDKNLVLEKR